MENRKENFFDKIRKIKGFEFIVIGIIAILVLIVLFGDTIFTKNENETITSEYVSDLERRMENTLSQIKGAGKVSVAITVQGGNQTVIATDVTTIKNGNEIKVTETPLLVGGKVVVLNELFPEIRGVIIVSSGADKLSVKLDLVNAATTLLAIDDSRVQILTGK